MTTFDNSRPANFARYILENKTTIRATAKAFNISKSTVHNDLNYRLEHTNNQLYKKVQKHLKENFKNKHIIGGASTKLKYEKLKNIINVNDKYDNF